MGAPGEFKVLTSADGGNFEEAVCWRSAGRSEASYQEVALFDRPREIQAVTVVMRSPQPWGFFGLNNVVVLAMPGPVMLVSGTAAGGEELCLVSTGQTLEARGCLDSIASGSGGDVFKFN